MNDEEFRALLVSAASQHQVDPDLKRQVVLRARRRTVVRRGAIAVAAVAAATVVAVVTGYVDVGERGPEPTATATDGSAGPVAGPVDLQFDDLGGGFETVKVFRGPASTAEDREPVGTYRDGDVVQVTCVVTGREVESDPAAGETRARSRLWLRLEGETPAYATAVYGRLTDSTGRPVDANVLPTCP